MNIQIATCPCSWGVWMPDGGPANVPYEMFLQQAEECGYRQIELGPDGYLPVRADELKDVLSTYHLGVCAGTATIPFLHLSETECQTFVAPLAERLNLLDVSDMVVMDGSLFEGHCPPKSQWTKSQWAGIYDKILHINDCLKRTFGIRMVFHPHADSAIEFLPEIEQMLSMDGIHLCFDTGHHVYCNGGAEKHDQSALDFIRQHKDRIPYLHFKNASGGVLKQVRANGWSCRYAFAHGAMCNLEDGIIDFPALKSVLDEINYEGTAVIEQDMAGQTKEYAYQCAKQNLQYLRKIGMIV